MRSYTTAVAKIEGPDDGADPTPEPVPGDQPGDIEFEVDGVQCWARKPQDGQIALMTTATSRFSPPQIQIAGTINFFFGVLYRDTATYLQGKLFDGEDPFDLDVVTEIIEDLFEEWAERPTKSRSDSSRSRKNTGKNSTEATPTST